jgi:hypothetical protein
MISQLMAKGRMQNMGGRVVEGNGSPMITIHGQHDRLAIFQSAALHVSLVDDDAGGILHRVGHRHFHIRGP